MQNVTVENIASVLPIARKFAIVAGINFSDDIFISSWKNLFNLGFGVIFATEDYSGMIGGIKYPDTNSGELIASELFWFVDPSKRGEGIKLLNAFELWAINNNCKRIIMVHLMDSMPEKVGRFYERTGYRKLEVHYVKEF